MNEFNPYAAPENLKEEPARLGATNDPLFIANSCLVARKGSDLPDICVYTGKVGGNVYVKKTLTYVKSLWLIFFLLGPLFGVIPYLLMRKKGKIGYYVSAEARAARFKIALINWGLFLGSFVSIYFADALGIDEIMFAFPALLIISVVVYLVKLQGLTAKWIDETTIGINGISLSVMNELVAASQL